LLFVFFESNNSTIPTSGIIFNVLEILIGNHLELLMIFFRKHIGNRFKRVKIRTHTDKLHILSTADNWARLFSDLSCYIGQTQNALLVDLACSFCGRKCCDWLSYQARKSRS
jgi:hypothetical protein